MTLYLARAIHGSNRPHLCEGSAKSPEEAIANETEDKPKEEKLQGMEDDSKPNSRTLYVHQNDQRQAVIHTLDVSPKHSKDARVIVKGFRHGIYRKDIEFHVGDVSEWIDQQIIRRRLDSKDTAFLSHVLLDMPNADRHIQKAASALHVNGSLLAFNPSITQIMAIVETVKRRYLPLQLDRVVELGPNMTGGREWDVRAVLPRALTGAGNEEKVAPVDVASPENTAQYAEDGDSEGDATEPKTRDEEEAQKPKRENRWGMVCRPKVGDRIAGGGFLRVWKKMKW